MEVSDAAKLRAVTDENAKLKRLLADTMLDNVVLKDLLGPCCTNQLRGSFYESSVVAGGYEQLVPYEVQDQELAFVQHGAKAARFRYQSGLIPRCRGMRHRQASGGVRPRSTTQRSKFV